MRRLIIRSAAHALALWPDPNAPKFFDMDGVLARYNWNAYLTETRPGVKLYEDERLHYYRCCEPDQTAIALAKAFHAAGHRVFVLTNVRSSLPWARADKAAWLEQHMPWLDTATRLIVADGDKAQAAMARSRMAGLKRTMPLFDDFNPNLHDWEAAGGASVKYLNGVNTPCTGPRLEYDGRV